LPILKTAKVVYAIKQQKETKIRKRLPGLFIDPYNMGTFPHFETDNTTKADNLPWRFPQ
jgi:hypothetical protein